MSQLTTKKKRRLRIGPGSAGRLMTTEQFDALRPDQFVRGNRYDLINGVLVVSPEPRIEERDPNEELGHLLVYRGGVSGPTYDIVTETQTYQTDLLPGFILPLSRLLAKADQWQQRSARSKLRRGPNAPGGGTDG